MLDQYTFEFDNANSGYIFKVGSYYAKATGWSNCNAGQSVTSGITFGAFFRFDTSSLPDHAQIEWVKFRVRGYRNAPAGSPQFFELRLRFGDIIGGTLDGTAAEWSAGSHMLTLTAKPADKTTLDLSDDGNDPLVLVNKSGDSDVSIIDHGTQGTGDSAWWSFFNVDTDTRCKLYVGFSVPSATLSGSGSLTCSAEVIRGGRAELAGAGELDADGDLIADGSAELAGAGELDALGGVLFATASAELVGSGELVSLATVERLCSATLAGVGELDAAAGPLIYGGIATLEGSGDLIAGAGILHSTAAATLTGIGEIFVAGGIAVPPLALHSATIAVAATDSDSIAVGAVDSGTISVADGDALTVGPRRNT